MQNRSKLERSKLMTASQLHNAVLRFSQHMQECARRHRLTPDDVFCLIPCLPSDRKLNGDCLPLCPLNKAKIPQDEITDLQELKRSVFPSELLPTSVALSQFLQQDLPF
jgi:hypothetical protein